jgi:hypothetical protein
VTETIINVRNKYEITKNIRYIMLNNISSNDTCVEEILRQFDINDIKKQRRLRYLGYIINFAVKIFLFGLNADTFEREIINNNKI